MIIEATDPHQGTILWELPEEFVNLMGNRVDPATIQPLLHSFMACVLLSRTIMGPLAKNADKLVWMNMLTLSKAMEEFIEIAEKRRPYPLVTAQEMGV